MTKVLDLSKVEDARIYIEQFRVAGRKPSYVKLSSGRTVFFHSMTDEDAVLVAHCLYDIEVEGQGRAAQRAGKVQ